MIFSDETTFFLNQVKRRVWNFPVRKKVVRNVRYPISVNELGCFSSKGFGGITCFKKNFNSQLICKISKNNLLPIPRKDLIWKLSDGNCKKPMTRTPMQVSHRLEGL